MAAQGRDGHTGLSHRLRRPLGVGDEHQGVTALRGHAGDQPPVGELHHGRLAQSPVRAVELRRRPGQRRGGRALGQTAVAVGLPPSVTVGDEAQGAVVPPRRLADRHVVATLGEPGPTGGHQVRPERDHLDRRAVPGHVRVVPDHGGQPTALWIESRRAVEVVARGQDRLPDVVRSRGEGDHQSPGGAAVGAVDLADRHHPGAVGARAQTAVGPPLPVDRLAREWPRRAARPGLPPHALIGQVHVGERTRPVARHQAARSPAVLVHPAADAHPLGREVLDALAVAVGVAAHEDDAASLERPGLQPVHGTPVRTDVGQRHPSRCGLRRSQRRGPTSERYDGDQ